VACGLLHVAVGEPMIQLDDKELQQVTGGLGALRQAFAQNHPIAAGVLRRLFFGPQQGGGGCPGGTCAPQGGGQ
jgi:bacteriocin-like protein